MVNWKVSGVVEDSEEEDDAFESQQLNLPVATKRTALETSQDTNAQTIWDVPLSSQEPESVLKQRTSRPSTPPPSTHNPQLLESSPLSSVPSDDELSGSQFEDRYAATHPSFEPTVSRPAGPRPAREESPDPLELDLDSVSTSYVRLTKPQPEFLLDRDTEPVELSKPNPRNPLEVSSNGCEVGQDHNDDPVAEMARTAAIRYERSLRPRKPIQEHPYLLESAHYTNILKSHGVRPLRMVREESSNRGAGTEADSQEKDFQDDTQSTTSDLLGDGWGSSQVLGRTQPEFDPSLPDFPPSSDPKTVSPPRRSITSSPGNFHKDTDATSPPGADDDLPSLDDLLVRARQGLMDKRSGSPKQSSIRKKLKKGTASASLSDLTPVTSSLRKQFVHPLPLESSASSPSKRQRKSRKHLPDPTTTPQPSRATLAVEIYQKPTPPNVDATPVDLTAVESDVNDYSDSAKDSANDSDSQSEAGLEILRYGRRARGVLPASHFRLAQSKKPNNPTTCNPRSLPESSTPTPRRGVAIRRTTSRAADLPSAFLSNDLYSSDDSEELSPVPKAAAERHLTQTLIHIEEDDDLSVVEDNNIDHMASRQRQRRHSSQASNRPETSTKSLHAVDEPAKRKRQTKITKHLNNNANTVHKHQQTKSAPQGQGRKRPRKLPRKPYATPPRLSILDVIQPQAPHFLRIAARTVKRRSGKGRAGPDHKSISLSTRRDQLDAGSVLQNWKRGKIQPQSSAHINAQQKRPALGCVSQNVLSREAPNQLKSVPTLAPVKATQMHEEEPSTCQHKRPLLSRKRAHARDEHVRPAQMEESMGAQVGKVGFHKQKRFLDALYRRPARTLDSRSTAEDVQTPSLHGQDVGRSGMPHHEPAVTVGDHDMKPRRRQQTRKSVAPSRIDTTAAQFQCINDPLPVDITHTPDYPLVNRESASHDGLLSGLGPFGTHYTHHFEVFPLPNGVFFHESTLIGSGCIDASLDPTSQQRIWGERPRVSLNLNNQTLRWGHWTGGVSSEFGILVDSIVYELISPSLSDALDVVNAARFVRNFIQNAISFTSISDAIAFSGRLHDILSSFFERIEKDLPTFNRQQQLQSLEVISEFIVVIVFFLTLCKENASLGSSIRLMEELLRYSSRTCITSLLYIGLDDIRSVYDHAQRLTFRERGIQPRQIVVHTWVLLIKVLERLQIPRMSFWDLTFSVMIKPEDKIGNDAQRFELLWQTMFTLLPLSEFDCSGVVRPGSRHEMSFDGWLLPQVILRRVFSLYKNNDRQAPSFNNYCKGLVSRCHWLVEHWGWQKPSSVIGTIFDFFASQNLSHLRNEEVYQSPRFLEQLDLDVDLGIQPEDRCFHVFLKLVAITLRQLGHSGATKEIKNLVFRILPNHNRQYLKEQNVYQHDLAALRNHHDLLCTLFWAAPAEFRPQITLLEKLVVPATSHKEACIINLRAWGQLAHFLVATEPIASFSPLTRWQNNTFQQLIDQYHHIDTEIQQQFQAMSEDDSQEISQDFRNAIVASNKAATMDVLRFSVSQALSASRHAKSIELAIIAGNSLQMQQILRHFSASSPEYPWAILQDVLKTTEVLLDRLETSMKWQDQLSQASQFNDNLMLFDHDLTTVVFSLARRMLTDHSKGAEPHQPLLGECIEQSIIQVSRLCSLLVRCGSMRLVQCFRAGRYSLFERLPTNLGLREQKFLALFLAVTLQQTGLDLSELESSSLLVWLQALIKPARYMVYEGKLAATLCSHSIPFVPFSYRAGSTTLDYDTACSLFEDVLSWMRRSLLSADTQEKKTLLSKYSTALRTTMAQMEHNLLLNVSEDVEHSSYVGFIRRIVSLIKSHGAGICAITAFFYKVSREYSPPSQDPQLQVAQIQSYGIRLAEGDSRIAPQLFSYLHHNFKQALLNGNLGKEVAMLQKGMQSKAVVLFTMNTLLPAVLEASVSRRVAFIMFDTFCEALRLRITTPTVLLDLDTETLDGLSSFIQAVMRWATQIHTLHDIFLSAEHVHLFRKVVFFLNSIQALLEAASMSSHFASSESSLQACLVATSRLFAGAEAFLEAASRLGSSDLEPWELLADCDASDVEDAVQSPIKTLANELVLDIDKTWVVSAQAITVQAPTRPQGLPATQSGLGTRRPMWQMLELVGSLHEQLRLWNSWWYSCTSSPRARRHVGFDETLLL